MVNNHEVYCAMSWDAQFFGFFFFLCAESRGCACRGLSCFISDQSSWCWMCTFTWIISLNPPKGPIMVAIFFYSPHFMYEKMEAWES